MHRLEEVELSTSPWPIHSPLC